MLGETLRISGEVVLEETLHMFMIVDRFSRSAKQGLQIESFGLEISQFQSVADPSEHPE